MSIEDTQVIDIISTDPNAEEVVLTATDHLEWGGKEHLMTLQDKLNAYIAFIESGEIFESYPNAKGKKLKIDVVCKYQPDEEGRKFLAQCGEAVENAGFGFGYRVHEI
jgi:hypothetical protein